MAYDDVYGANSSNIVRFLIEPADAADRNASIFGMFNGSESEYPYYGKMTTVPTANQKLAQLRTNYVVRAVTAYAPVVGVKFARDSGGTAYTATFGPALEVWFEQDKLGAFIDPAYIATNGVGSKHRVTDITDSLGTGGMSFTKTKKGLLSLLDTLSTVSFDNGVTGPFGTLSTSGAIVLKDGSTTAGAPVLTDGVRPAGLTISYLA